jgi:SprT protein
VITERELALRLEKYLPSGTEHIIARWVARSGVHFKITMPRNSVYGDYMHPWGKNGHRITVNGNLNKFSFLVTVVHEFAHLKVYEKHGNRVKPHGTEWKNEYREMLMPFLKEEVFPSDIAASLTNYMKDPNASSCTDTNLMMALKKYDRVKPIYLEEIPENARFEFNSKIFVKGPKMRTRYKCREVRTNDLYFIGQMAEINPLI